MRKVGSSGGSSASTSANSQWQDSNQAEKKGPIKILHLIIVAILMMILGAYLARGIVPRELKIE